jgi:UDP-2-acetamido-3-amino-2,3-dideoxy-glucuronate N-acetyltransferase
MSLSDHHSGCFPSFVDLPVFSDPRGDLTVAEFGTLPFFPRRLFIQSVNRRGTVRGGHAHHVCSQLLIVIEGSIEVTLESCGGIQTEILQDSSVGLLIPPMVWASQTFQNRSGKVLVLASEPYSEADYVRNKNKFDNLLGIHLAK